MRPEFGRETRLEPDRTTAVECVGAGLTSGRHDRTLSRRGWSARATVRPSGQKPPPFPGLLKDDAQGGGRNERARGGRGAIGSCGMEERGRRAAQRASDVERRPD